MKRATAQETQGTKADIATSRKNKNSESCDNHKKWKARSDDTAEGFGGSVLRVNRGLLLKRKRKLQGVRIRESRETKSRFPTGRGGRKGRKWGLAGISLYPPIVKREKDRSENPAFTLEEGL